MTIPLRCRTSWWNCLESKLCTTVLTWTLSVDVICFSSKWYSDRWRLSDDIWANTYSLSRNRSITDSKIAFTTITPKPTSSSQFRNQIRNQKCAAGLARWQTCMEEMKTRCTSCCTRGALHVLVGRTRRSTYCKFRSYLLDIAQIQVHNIWWIYFKPTSLMRISLSEWRSSERCPSK